MDENLIAASELQGWQKMLAGYPWFNCDGCYSLPAYSEYMPSPLVGRKPLGEIDSRIFREGDPSGWWISEIEEEYELKPGIEHVGKQIFHSILKLGRGSPEHHIHGHSGQNLKDNPYWPAELAAMAGKLPHERFVTLLPMMLSRTQDDKGRVIWSLFGNSVHDPEQVFWKNFYTAPGIERQADESIRFFITLLEKAYGLKLSGKDSLSGAGFRILSSAGSNKLTWTKAFLIKDDSSFEGVRYLVTFRAFSFLPQGVKDLYLAGRLNLIPFPGSLVFWGMPGYLKLQKQFFSAGQIPLLNIVAHSRGIGGLKVPQAGWFHEARPGNGHENISQELLHDTFHRTNRWQRLHRYQDELNEDAKKYKLVKVFFSTEPDFLGLYDKPMARNVQIWNHEFELILDGPHSEKKQILLAEEAILSGGLYGYRFFSPPMRTGEYNVYWHRSLVAWLAADNESPVISTDLITGHLAGYHRNDKEMTFPVEMWPRFHKRPVYLSALRDFISRYDHYSHQTAFNIISLFEAWNMQKMKPLSRSYAYHLLNVSKRKSFDQWLDDLPLHAENSETGIWMKEEIIKILEPGNDEKEEAALTYGSTAGREFEENWWNEIKFLAHGQFINTDNADIAKDEITHSQKRGEKRDIEKLGDYFISRHLKSISDTGMEGRAFCGELPFKWQTDFDYSLYGGWSGNQNGSHYERDILLVIPGKNRKQAVVFGDHYDTAFMEDIFETTRGGTGARISANGADDNYSASSTLLLAAPVFLKMSAEGKLERDIWLIHLTGEEFPSDCMGARNLCKTLIERSLILNPNSSDPVDLSETEVVGVYVMDMIGHNRDSDQDIFQISPGKSAASLYLGWQAHIANQIWNRSANEWNKTPDRIHRNRGKRISGTEEIPETAKFLPLIGEVRTQYNPHSSIFNTDGQIFSDVGIPVVLFMENYDINRTGYHDTKDTMENIDLDYGAALAAIAIETVARVATNREKGL
jgi:hypothetical protein